MDASAYNMSFDKEQLSVLCANYDRRIDSLAAENAKLRKLVREAHSCKTNEGCCEDCYREEGCCPIERRMQEVGIEVGE